MATLDNRVGTMGQDEFFKHLSQFRRTPEAISQETDSESSHSIATEPGASAKQASQSQHNKNTTPPVVLSLVKISPMDSFEAGNRSHTVDNVEINESLSVNKSPPI